MNKTLPLVILMLISQPTFSAALLPEQRCAQLGEIALQASELRLDGIDQDTAFETINKNSQMSETEIKTEEIEAAVLISYMAKMKPEKARDYYINECRKDILK